MCGVFTSSFVYLSASLGDSLFSFVKGVIVSLYDCLAVLVVDLNDVATV